MLATHKVKDSNNTTVGFIIGEGFYSEHSVRVSVDSIDNITITKSGKLGKGDKFDTIPIYTIGERFPYKR